jgi:hypothetical protein
MKHSDLVNIPIESYVKWEENELYWSSLGWKERPIIYQGIIKSIDYQRQNVNVLLNNGEYKIVNVNKLFFN